MNRSDKKKYLGQENFDIPATVATALAKVLKFHDIIRKKYIFFQNIFETFYQKISFATENDIADH